MKAFVQRVSGITILRAQEDLGSDWLENAFVGVGMVVLLGWTEEDERRDDLEEAEAWLRKKIRGLRVFPDEEGRMNLSLEDYLKAEDIEGGILWVPQFTLAGKLDSGFRPSFSKAMTPQLAKERFQLWRSAVDVEKTAYKNNFGVFGANMELTFTNWGPVSLMLER